MYFIHIFACICALTHSYPLKTDRGRRKKKREKEKVKAGNRLSYNAFVTTVDSTAVIAQHHYLNSQIITRNNSSTSATSHPLNPKQSVFSS
jgi:hypothetical protein